MLRTWHPKAWISLTFSMLLILICQRKSKITVCGRFARSNFFYLDISHVSKLVDFGIVHRIGRTGRSGKTGIATTFINQHCSEQIRLDLKLLLREAKQRVPPFLAAMEDPSEKYGLSGGCTFCGGLGHRINECPKLEQQRRQQLGAIMSNRHAGERSDF